jgi:hypothetical protein
VKWNRKTVELHPEPGENGGIADAIKAAENLWSDEAAWKRKVDEFAMKKLLPLKNESWLGDDEKSLLAYV